MIDPVKIAKALSDPIRYKIMLMLVQCKEGCCTIPGQDKDHRPGLCNCEFVSEMGLIQSRVSYHMKELADAGLVTEEPRGKWKMYYLNQKTLKQYCELLARDFNLK